MVPGKPYQSNEINFEKRSTSLRLVIKCCLQDKLFKTAQTMEIDDTLLTTDERVK